MGPSDDLHEGCRRTPRGRQPQHGCTGWVSELWWGREGGEPVLCPVGLSPRLCRLARVGGTGQGKSPGKGPAMLRAGTEGEWVSHLSLVVFQPCPSAHPLVPPGLWRHHGWPVGSWADMGQQEPPEIQQIPASQCEKKKEQKFTWPPSEPNGRVW